MQALWEEANRRAHQRFIQIVKDEGTENVSTTGGDVTIDLRGLLIQVAQQVGLSGKRLESIPPDSGQLVVMSSDELSAIQTAADLLDKGALAITILALLLFALAVFLARGRRRETLRGVAIGFIVAGLLALGRASDRRRRRWSMSSPRRASIEPAAQDIWDIGTALLSETAWAAIINGILIMIARGAGRPVALGAQAARAGRALHARPPGHAVRRPWR